MSEPSNTGVDFYADALETPLNSQTESILRPLSFEDFVGQDKTIERLEKMNNISGI